MEQRIGVIAAECSSDEFKKHLGAVAGFEILQELGPFANIEEEQEARGRLNASVFGDQDNDRLVESSGTKAVIESHSCGNWILANDLFCEAEVIPGLLEELSRLSGNAFWYVDEPELGIAQLMFYRDGQLLRSLQNDEGDFMTEGDPLPEESPGDEQEIDLPRTVERLLGTPYPPSNKELSLLLVGLKPPSM